MPKHLLTVLAILSCASAWARDPAPSENCSRPPFSQTPGPVSNADKDSFTVFKRTCYTDASGSYILDLLVNKAKPAPKSQLSHALQIQLFKLDKGTRLQSMARDASSANEAGVAFLPELIEVGDIDGDGLIDPIIVYRFFERDRSLQDDAFSGRIKIIMFYKGQKVAIRAVTGTLDGSRSTTASANFFLLPKKVRSYLVKKMKRMYDDGQFGFDNSFEFNPRRE